MDFEQQVLQYKKDALICITRGAYSSTEIEGVFRCLKDCDLPTLTKRYLTELKRPIPNKEINREWAEIRSCRAETHHLAGFAPWMIRNGYWEDLEVQGLSIGDFYFADELLR